MKDLLVEVKQANEDFEWYPTTRQMLELVATDIRKEYKSPYQDNAIHFSILDIGAGNGNALQTICELTNNSGQQYAIEKSRVLVSSLPKDVFVIGTDFHRQTLIDKKVDVIFCNPPYSEFDAWMKRIVSEANCRLVYMVVPQRWKDNPEIVAMLNKRCELDKEMNQAWPDRVKATYQRERGLCEPLGSMSFENSEFRKARAQVDVLKIRFEPKGNRESELKADPFDIWFDETFSINAKKVKDDFSPRSQAQKLHELVEGQNLIERLEELYHDAFEKLLATYRGLEAMDASLFEELGVDLTKIKEGLRFKIKGLKNLYWQELFSNLSAITDRLTSTSREKLLGKLTDHTSIDFDAENAYAVVIWAIKNANAYFDDQLLEVYLSLADKENIRNYKSNTRIITDDWRFTKKDATHYALDYRLVLNRWPCFSLESYKGYAYPNGLHNDVHTSLNDICTIAENLGFSVKTRSMDFQWEPGRLYEFNLADGRLFMDVRAFKKGTIHIRLNQVFMKKLNVEAGRLNGWVKSPQEAMTEMGIDDAEEHFGSNFKLKSIKLLPDLS